MCLLRRPSEPEAFFTNSSDVPTDPAARISLSAVSVRVRSTSPVGEICVHDVALAVMTDQVTSGPGRCAPGQWPWPAAGSSG